MTSGQGLGFVVVLQKVTGESTGTPVVLVWEKDTKKLIRVIITTQKLMWSNLIYNLNDSD